MSSERRRSGAPPAARAVSGHFARKRFGQHFLADRSALAAIVSAINPGKTDAIVEIGPGLGVLTTELLRQAARIAAVEIDRDLCRRLRARYGPDRLILFEADALGFDLAEAAAALEASKLRVVGNLPYNISSPLLVSLLNARGMVRDQHFLLQKEVVERIVAAPGSSDYGRLSVLLQTFYEVEMLFEVPPEAFDPPPRVDSAVLRMTVREQPALDDPAPLQKLLAAAFAQRRKMIRSTLLPWLRQQGIEAPDLQGEWRAEEIDVTRYCALANQLRSINSIL